MKKKNGDFLNRRKWHQETTEQTRHATHTDVFIHAKIFTGSSSTKKQTAKKQREKRTYVCFRRFPDTTLSFFFLHTHTDKRNITQSTMKERRESRDKSWNAGMLHHPLGLSETARSAVRSRRQK
ncbi:Uncharacterized protein APZ42_027557 [Daphnia magna]|uniref:Uncharacterized protein n=1 Tax=Daphnia magna TaxID=35525 RepID=A0A164R946_9CRUS|nr:Uncharacterized protein APZ42_027557 [Daphnia magna]